MLKGLRLEDLWRRCLRSSGGSSLVLKDVTLCIDGKFNDID